MARDDRIFARLLSLLPGATIVPWIEPRARESLGKYAARLAATISAVEPVVVCGVSFGGIVARELALQLNAKACVLVSSVRSPAQFPPLFRVCRPLARLNVDATLNSLGTLAAAVPRRLRTPATARLAKLAGEAGAWRRWATTAVLRWQAAPELDTIPVVQIHGDLDATFPIRYIISDVVIPGGGHLLALTHAAEIVKVLAELAT